MKNKVISTAYAPLQPPYQVINYDHNVAMQIGTLIVTIQKDNKSVFSEFEIETHSYPVVAYENKNYDKIANNQLTQNRFLEGAVWNKVEIKEVTTLCLAGATLSWLSYMEILEHISSLNCYRGNPDVGLYWQLNKLGVKVLPPEDRECTIHLSLMVQFEESGLSLQSQGTDQLFLNVSVAEDDYQSGKENVFYNCQEEKWGSREWKDNEIVYQSLVKQLSDYRVLLRYLLSGVDDRRFNVKYETNEDRFRDIVKRLNNTNNKTNLAY